MWTFTVSFGKQNYDPILLVGDGSIIQSDITVVDMHLND